MPEPGPQPEAKGPVIVVIAEDEDVVRAAVAQVVGAEGYRILEARDGAEALHLVHLAWPYLHLVITDVMMPTVDGLELGRRLRDECPGLPVLYMSGYSRGDVFNRDGLGTDAPFIRKPFKSEELLASVRELVGASSLQAPERPADRPPPPRCNRFS